VTVQKTIHKADFLAACKATDSRNQALEEIRDKGADVILSVFRLLKNSLVHAVDNKAVQTTCKETHGTITDFAAIVGGYVSVTFVDDTIFVCGQLLRASRSIYESAMEVGRMLGNCGVSELSFTTDVTYDDMMKLCEVFSISTRTPELRGRFAETKIPHITIRKIETELQKADEDQELPEMEKVLRAYASALVVMRQFYDRIAKGKTVMPHRVKRVAQRVVGLSEGAQGSLLALTTLANAHRDEAGRSVQSAILSVCVARQLTGKRSVLAQLAMSALIADMGRMRITGTEGRLAELAENVERAIPSLTSALCISTGGVNVQNAVRTVTTYEATFIERQHLMGPVYKRTMSPLVQSKILYAVRQLLEQLAPRDTRRPLSPLDALAALSGKPGVDDFVYKLLIRAVGVMPTGTIVEFETGEWGIVVGPSKNKNALSRPRVKLMTDRSGQIFSKPKEIDLGEATGGQRFPAITGVVEPSRAKFNVAAVLMN